MLDSVSSPITKRVYNMALNELMAWSQRAPRHGFTKATVSAWWRSPAGVAARHVFRPVNRAGAVTGEHLGEKVVWHMLRQYAAEVGVPGIAPHDLRRTCSKLCRAAGAELEQIQLLLLHPASPSRTHGLPGSSPG
ncbi:MAG TPA: hypothetical protein VNX18_22525 [Bryobacteraceae bacterium]|nr:hypothetical protein [Bryobacteraceae bacterium]